MIVDILSDLHGELPELEGGDLLILGGDYTKRDDMIGWSNFIAWLDNQKYRKIVMIAGNHDMKIEEGFVIFKEENYLCDSGMEFEGLKIWGSPWTAWFRGINEKCTAFTCKSDAELAEKWAKIPEDTDILITHSPPYGILDEVYSEAMHASRWENVGSKSLLARVHHVRPELHVFGHIHEAYGQYEAGDVHFVNASIMDINYRPSNKPVRLEL